MSRARFGLSAVACALVLACPPTAAWAQPVLYVDDDAPLGGNGQGWSTAFRYLQDALAAAIPGSGVSEIRVAQGTYKPDRDEGGNVTPGWRKATFDLIPAVALHGGFAGLGAPDPIQRDPRLFETVLSGDLAGDDLPNFVNYGENAYHVVSAEGVPESACIDGFTIRAGNADFIETYDLAGGMAVFDGSPTVSNCAFVANRAISNGGGVYIDGGAPTFTACAFAGNVSLWGGGGVLSWMGDPTFTDCTFTLNSATSIGGGICAAGYSTLSGCAFTENDALKGGAAVVNWATVNDCTFANNTASYYGGAVLGAGYANITGCTFTANAAPFGGGLSMVHQHMIADCSFADNVADQGGAVFVENSFGELISFEGCTLLRNRAQLGGGMYIRAGNPTMSQCVFQENTGVQEGGGLHVDGFGSRPTILSSLFVGNTAASGGGIRNAEGVLSVENAVFLDNTASVYGGGLKSDDGEVSLTNCTFEFNTSVEEGGGARFHGDDATLSACSFTGNASGYGGGGVMHKYGAASITGCDFVGNAATNGAGLDVGYEIDVSVKTCRFIENTATDDGGGVQCFSIDGGADFIDCIFTGNQASLGGGLHSYVSSPQIVSCLFTENSVPVSGGGGLFIRNGQANVIGCTVAHNEGGGIQTFAAEGTQLADCIVWHNTLFEVHGLPAIHYCNVRYGYPGPGNINADPLFADPAGGDFRLLPGSPCIDAGDNDALPPQIVTDLAGNPRFVDDPSTPDTGNGDPPIVDMGAYEFQVDLPGDINGDGVVNVDDLLLLIAAWGDCPGPPEPCPADLNGDGVVNVNDLMILLANWS